MTEAVDDTAECRARAPPAAVRRPTPWSRRPRCCAAARAPVIIVGDGVALRRRARRGDGARRGPGRPGAWRADLPSRGLSRRSPAVAGGLFLPSPPGVRKALDGADALVIVGATVFTWFLHSAGEPVPAGAARRADRRRRPRDRTQPRGHPRHRGRSEDDGGGGDGRRWPRVSARRRARPLTARTREIGRARAEGERGFARPLRPSAGRRSRRRLMRALAEVAPRDTVIVDESATSLPHVLRHLPLATPNSSGSKTGTLGWAMGAALECSSPRRPGRWWPRSATAPSCTVPRRCGRPHGTGCRSPTSSPTTPPTRSSSRGC